jgi:hypothetical protein
MAIILTHGAVQLISKAKLNKLKCEENSQHRDKTIMGKISSVYKV